MGQAPARPTLARRRIAAHETRKVRGQLSADGGLGYRSTICQVADAGLNGVFNANGTVLLGDSWLKSNGSVVY